MSIHQNLKQLRLDRGMTQEEVAARLHITRQAVSSYESGRTRPDIDTLMRLAEVYGVELESILYGQQENRRVTCFRRAAWGIFITLTLLILARSALLCGNNLFFPIATGEVLDAVQRQARFRISEIWTALEGLALTVALIGFLVLLCLELAWRIPVSLRQRAIYLGVLAGSLLGISYCFAWADPIFHAPINYTLVPFRILSRLLFFQLLALIFSAFQRRRRKSVDPQ